jgi:TRAP-type C4-dicarboxylate transport system permease small subunit
MLSIVRRTVDAIEKVGTSIAMGAVLLMMLLVTANVVGRSTVGSAISGSNQFIVLFLMPVTVYLGIAAIEAADEQIKVELLTRRMSERTLLVRDVLYKTVVLVILVVIVEKTTGNFLESFAAQRTTGGTIQFPIWLSDLIVPVGFGLLTTRFVISFIDDIRDLVGLVRGDR